MGSRSTLLHSSYCQFRSFTLCQLAATPAPQLLTARVLQYVDAVYFVMMTLTSVGYGDITPKLTGEPQTQSSSSPAKCSALNPA